MSLMAPPIVWDNVFSPSACAYLHATSSIGGLGDELHTAFDRSLPPRTPLESALHSVLLELDDPSPVVEYWWRDEWQHVEAHCDVDEELFEQEGRWSFPTNGHVLYLRAGSAVRGPTCVWARGGAVREDFGPLTTVPARVGRLLRFPGDCMHAVPEPTDVWLDDDDSDEWLGDVPEGDDEDDYVRSVVLFNTWQAMPLDVPVAPATDPIESVRQLAEDFGGSVIEDVIASMASPDDQCLPSSQWARVSPAVVKGSGTADRSGSGASVPRSYYVALLGERLRRRQDDEEIELAAPSGLVEALIAERTVTSFVD